MGFTGGPGIHGYGLYSVQGGKGSPVTPASTLGIIDNLRGISRSGMTTFRSVGGWQPVEFKPGMALGEVSFDITAIQDKNFLQYAIRGVDGQLSYLTLGLGYNKAVANRYSWQVQDCRIGSVDLSCEAGDTGGPFAASVNLTGGKIDIGTVDLDMSWQGTSGFFYYEGVWSTTGADWTEGYVLSARIAVNHNVQAQGVIAGPSTTRDPARVWDYLDQRVEEITGTLVLRTGADATNPQADVIPAFNATLVFANISEGSPAQTMQVALTGCKIDDMTFQIPAEANVTFECPFRARTIAIT